MHHRLEEADAERFVADWFEEHHFHEGVGYETGEWSRVMTCWQCGPKATHDVEVVDRAQEIVYAARKTGKKVYVY
jgi:hypothetical protein